MRWNLSSFLNTSLQQTCGIALPMMRMANRFTLEHGLGNNFTNQLYWCSAEDCTQDASDYVNKFPKKHSEPAMTTTLEGSWAFYAYCLTDNAHLDRLHMYQYELQRCYREGARSKPGPWQNMHGPTKQSFFPRSPNPLTHRSFLRSFTSGSF